MLANVQREADDCSAEVRGPHALGSNESVRVAVTHAAGGQAALATIVAQALSPYRGSLKEAIDLGANGLNPHIAKHEELVASQVGPSDALLSIATEWIKPHLLAAQERALRGHSNGNQSNSTHGHKTTWMGWPVIQTPRDASQTIGPASLRARIQNYMEFRPQGAGGSARGRGGLWPKVHP